ncbi:MAG: hypothetical protein E2O82_03620 [Betaproteobacteria bacterium]|nr:MAG: hypothetical protein E2O82_03620 [Betaproteobacteria bacterium]
MIDLLILLLFFGDEMKQAFLLVLEALVALLKSFTGLLVPMFAKYLMVHRDQILAEMEKRAMERAAETETEVDDEFYEKFFDMLEFVSVFFKDKAPKTMADAVLAEEPEEEAKPEAEA